MVDISIDWQVHEFELNGETITIELCPMQVGEVFQLMRINVESPDEDQINVMRGIFEKRVRNIGNLTINNQPVSIEQLVNLTPLMGLAGEILTRLSKISDLPKVQEKNSERQSTSQESDVRPVS